MPQLRVPLNQVYIDLRSAATAATTIAAARNCAEAFASSLESGARLEPKDLYGALEINSGALERLLCGFGDQVRLLTKGPPQAHRGKALWLLLSRRRT